MHPAGSPEADHGAPHGVDVPYMFENLETMSRPATDDDRRISDAMAAYWTNFAKYFDPNGKGLPTWPAFSDSHRVVMDFAGTPHTGPVPSEGSLQVLDRYFAWRRSPEGAAAAASSAAAPTGIREKKPVFGGACRLCPWGAMAEVVQAAMRPYGYDVQICYSCNAADAPRIVSEARMPPPYRRDPRRARDPRAAKCAGTRKRRLRRGRDPVPAGRLPGNGRSTRRRSPERTCA